jgi:chromosome segregation ATPase
MPRLGVTYSDVARTATKLVEQNIHPTIEEVRKLLCTGSNSTINRHLRQWRDTQGNAMEAEKGLPETLLIAVKGIYAAIQEEAAHKISAIETEAKEKLNQCDVQLNQLTHQHTILFQTNRALENKINAYQLHEIASQKMIDTLNQTIDKKISENQLLQERIDDKKSEIKRITDQLKHAQHNLDHYREAIKQERDAEKQRYELQISTLEQQVHQYQANLSTAQNKMAALIQKTESVENEKNKIEFNLQKIVEICHKDKLSLQRYEINYMSFQNDNVTLRPK